MQALFDCVLSLLQDRYEDSDEYNEYHDHCIAIHFHYYLDHQYMHACIHVWYGMTQITLSTVGPRPQVFDTLAQLPGTLAWR